jgi:hypothetical protein
MRALNDELYVHVIGREKIMWDARETSRAYLINHAHFIAAYINMKVTYGNLIGNAWSAKHH